MSHLRTALAASCCALFLANAAPGQERKQADDKPGDAMIYKYLCAEADKLSGKFLGGAKTLDAWQQARPRHYQEYMDMLGLWPIPEKTPLKATLTGTVEAHGVVVEKIHFQSKPGLYVTANLYRPKNVKGKLPAIVYVCGHSYKGRDGNKSAYQEHGFWFANNGYVCLILDTLQLGEIYGVHHGTYGTPYRHLKSYGLEGKDKVETRSWWYSLGYTPAGVEAWNGVRAIDYLETRPEVDRDKIGVTGISGGGAATFWIAAADERVKVAVPVSGMSDLESYVKNKIINNHCDCMFFYNTYQWDWTTIAAMIAPRPMLFANSDNDPIFPMDGNRRIMKKLDKIYTMYGKPNDVQEYVSEGGHAYRPDLRIAIFKFFNKHLKGDTTTPVEDSAKYTPLKGLELRVFPTDDDLPKDALNGRIDETFVPMAKVKLPDAGKFEEWKKGMIVRIRTTCFRPLPSDVPPAKMIEDDVAATISSEPGIRSLISGFAPREKDKIVGRILYVANLDEADWLAKSPEAAKTLINNYLPDGGFFSFPRGTKMLAGDQLITAVDWSRESPPNYVERSHLLLGRTEDQGRVRDVIATLNLSESVFAKTYPKAPKGSWTLVGRGRGGILAAYAALFEPSIKEVVVINPPKTHKEGPHFLNVLRILDIPEALGLLAPRPLTIVGGKDAAFDRTAEIYRLAGAADKLVRK